MKEILEGLNKTIEKLREENKKLYFYKQEYEYLAEKHQKLKQAYSKKQNIARVFKIEDGINYSLQILEVFNTPEGVVIIVK